MIWSTIQNIIKLSGHYLFFIYNEIFFLHILNNYDWIAKVYTKFIFKYVLLLNFVIIFSLNNKFWIKKLLFIYHFSLIYKSINHNLYRKKILHNVWSIKILAKRSFLFIIFEKYISIIEKLQFREQNMMFIWYWYFLSNY